MWKDYRASCSRDNFKGNMRAKPMPGDVVLRVGDDGKLKRLTVKKVGRIYFYCKTSVYWEELKYYISDWRMWSEYGGRGEQLYQSRQEWEDEKESQSLSSKIYSAFDRFNGVESLSLDQLRRIYKIIYGEKDG